MKIIDFPNTLGGVSFEKLVNYMRERKPFFSIKRFPLPHTPTPSKRTTTGAAPLESPYNTELKNSIFYTFVYLKCLLLNYI